MIPRGLVEATVETSFGPVPLWSLPGALTGSKPLILCITGAWAEAADMTGLPAVVAPDWDAVIMRLPGNETPALSETSVAAWGRAVSEVIEKTFANRTLVMMGLSIGALVALAARSANIRWVIAIEPPLSTAKLWPMIDGLKALWVKEPSSRAFVTNIFGVSDEGVADIQYRDLFDGHVPVEVVVGDVPLHPKRNLPRYPSFIDAEDRAWLASRPGVTVSEAPGAGHNIHVFAAPFLLQRTRAVQAAVLAAPAADGALVAATPLSARRILFLGQQAELNAEAYRRRNPLADVTASTSATGEGGYDVVAASQLSAGEAIALSGLLAEGGHLIGRIEPAELTAAGLTLCEPGADGICRGRKGPGEAPLRIFNIVFAATLMDIRTRLPSQAMQSEPDLIVSHARAPQTLPDVPLDQPKILIVQRPAASARAQWVGSGATAIARGWMLVLEFDDHPELIANHFGTTVDEEGWERYRYQHAIQTSTWRLVDLFRQFNPEVALFRNAIFDLAPFPEPRTGPVRVFYGGVTRGPFAVDCAQALAPVADRFPDVQFVVIGDRAVFDALPGSRKEFHDYRPYDDYLKIMASCEISLSPLQTKPMIDTKSDAKFLDASRAGLLTIGSPAVYREAIIDGETGLIAQDREDWPRLLSAALADPAWRRRMARKAWETVRAERMFAQQVTDRKTWYRSLWARREALTQALYERLPELEAAVRDKQT